MYNLTEVVIKQFEHSKYIKPITMHFMLNGKKRIWDMLEVHDSVVILLYNISRNLMVFVKQFRPAVYYSRILKEDLIKIDINKYPVNLGITLELCAGIVDKNLPLAAIAAEEIFEECGYKVQVENLTKVSSFRSGVGTGGSLQTLFYCEVTDDMKISSGGGIDDELIEVVEMSVPAIKKYISQDYMNSPPSFLYGIYWFLYNKGVENDMGAL